MRVAVVRRDDPVPEKVAHHLLCPPPERQLRLAVPFDDEATLVDAHDGVVRRLEDQPELLLAVAESRLGLLPSRGVLDLAEHAQRAAVGFRDGSRCQLPPHDGAVAAAEWNFHA